MKTYVVGGAVRADALGAAQVAAEDPEPGHEHVPSRRTRRRLRREQCADLRHLLSLRQRPRLDEVLAGQVGNGLEPGGCQAVGIDAQRPAGFVEKELEQLGAVVRR